jgi:hypothetical protein
MRALIRSWLWFPVLLIVWVAVMLGLAYAGHRTLAGLLVLAGLVIGWGGWAVGTGCMWSYRWRHPRPAGPPLDSVPYVDRNGTTHP